MVAVGCVAQVRSGVVTAETSVLLASRLERFDGTSPLILYCHGSGNTGQELMGYKAGWSTIPEAIAAAGFIVIASTFATTTNWGNAASVTAMEEAKTWGQANGAKAGDIGLWGYSMGFYGVANFWDDHPADVGAVFGVCPVVHGANFYTDNASNQAAMDAAYAGSFATNGAPRSPHLLVPNIAGSDAALRIHYSSLDANIRAADVAAFAADVGCVAVDLEPGAGGHIAHLSDNNDVGAIVEHFGALR